MNILTENSSPSKLNIGCMCDNAIPCDLLIRSLYSTAFFLQIEYSFVLKQSLPSLTKTHRICHWTPRTQRSYFSPYYPSFFSVISASGTDHIALIDKQRYMYVCCSLSVIFYSLRSLVRFFNKTRFCARLGKGLQFIFTRSVAPTKATQSSPMSCF